MDTVSGMWNGTATVENSIAVPVKLKIRLPYTYPAILPLDIYSKELKTESGRAIWTLMSIVTITALIIIAKMWKQIRTDDWISKMWYIHKQDMIQP